MPLSSGDEGLQDRAWPTGGHARITPRSRGYPETASFSEWGGGESKRGRSEVEWVQSGTQLAVLYIYREVSLVQK